MAKPLTNNRIQQRYLSITSSNCSIANNFTHEIYTFYTTGNETSSSFRTAKYKNAASKWNLNLGFTKELFIFVRLLDIFVGNTGMTNF